MSPKRLHFFLHDIHGDRDLCRAPSRHLLATNPQADILALRFDGDSNGRYLLCVPFCVFLAGTRRNIRSIINPLGKKENIIFRVKEYPA